jgi:protein-S-isoprenylcysteine O-methyltransferase Ste14
VDSPSGGAWAARWRVKLGFAGGILYLIFAQPTPRRLAVGSAIALLGLLLRGLAAGQLEKNQSLATSGLYAGTRHPLYLGSLLMGAGFVVAGASWWLAGVFALFFGLVYGSVIRREDEFLRQKFGRVYDQYASETPVLVPRWDRLRHASAGFRWERYRRNREYEAALGFAAAVVILVVKMSLK